MVKEAKSMVRIQAERAGKDKQTMQDVTPQHFRISQQESR